MKKEEPLNEDHCLKIDNTKNTKNVNQPMWKDNENLFELEFFKPHLSEESVRGSKG